MSSASNSSILTFNEACDFLKIKKSRLRTAIFRREIPYIKIGRLIRFDLNDLNTWIKQLKSNTA